MRQQIASAVDILIQANRLQGGPRRITAITEVVGMEQDTIVMQDIYKFVQKGINEEGKAYGDSCAPVFARASWTNWNRAGVRLPASAFRERVMMQA